MALPAVSAVPGETSPGLFVPGSPGSTPPAVVILTASTSSGVNASSTSP